LVGWNEVTLEEAIVMMEKHDGEAWIDGDRNMVVFVE